VADISTYISEHGGWATSVPGAREIRFDAPVGSPLPAQLTALGYIVEKTGASASCRKGSTKPVTTRVTHAGIAVVVQFNLRLP
jgi:hypothetical protein